MRAHIQNITLVLLSLIVSLVILELSLRVILGLGNPVLYDNHPQYGFRPLPNQHKERHYGAIVSTNNLGLRCDHDWDEKQEGKVLFLGDSVTYGGSYISNSELFSSEAVRESGLSACNGGVNAWGVENVYGLVVGTEFTPAQIYVTTFPEGDFYRGFVRMQGLPFFNRPPASAIDELLQFFFYVQMKRRYVHWRAYSSKSLEEQVVEHAVMKLSELDQYLQGHGFAHILFISPSRAQFDKGSRKPSTVSRLLQKHGLSPIYIVDKQDIHSFTTEELFVDPVHLSKKGHSVWASVMRRHIMTSHRAINGPAEGL